MIAACEATNTPLFVAHVLRFFPEFSRAKATVARGAIGKPGVIRTMRAGSFPRLGDTFYSAFYGDFARSGGVTLDLAIHDIDYHRWIAGDVERVFARGLAYSGKSQIDQSYLLLRFHSGAIGHIDTSWALPPGLRRHRLEIAGDQGLIEWDSFQPAPVITALFDPNNAGPAQQDAISPIAERDDPYFAQLAHVFDALSHNTPFLVSPNDALMALKVALAALESIRSGQAIELDSFQESPA
jgi:predicted dehydrogenase